MSLKQGSRVAVIGSGVSGLSFAHFLAHLRPDVHISLYEASSRPGGYIFSQRHKVGNDTVILEKGPRTLRGASDGTVLIADTLIRLGEWDKIKVIPSDSISNKKYLLSTNDQLVQVPNSIESFRKFIQSPLGKGLIPGFLKEPFQTADKGDDDESVHSFLQRRFGDSLPKNVISAVFHGVYAADINLLSAKTTLKSMFDAEKTHGSIVKSMFANAFKKRESPTLSPTLKDYESKFKTNGYDLLQLSKILKQYPMITVEGGLETFPNAIYESLKRLPNVEFKFQTPVDKVSILQNKIIINGDESKSYDHLHSTINASSLSQTLSPLLKTPKLASKLKYIDIFMINIFIPSHLLHHTGFGYLIPISNANPQKILGVIFDSDVEKGSIQLLKDIKSLQTPQPLQPEYVEMEYTKLTVMMGGHFWSNGNNNQPLDDLSADQLSENALKEVEKHLGISLDDTTCYVDHSYIKQCLPQFHVGYDSLKKEFQETLTGEFNGHLTQGGMSFGDGAGVPDCVSNAYRNAVALA